MLNKRGKEPSLEALFLPSGERCVRAADDESVSPELMNMSGVIWGLGFRVGLCGFKGSIDPGYWALLSLERMSQVSGSGA